MYKLNKILQYVLTTTLYIKIIKESVGIRSLSFSPQPAMLPTTTGMNKTGSIFYIKYIWLSVWKKTLIDLKFSN